MLLKDILKTTKDGDWGKDIPKPGFVPFRVIRGADFPEVRYGDVTSVPLCFLDKDTVYRRTLEPLDILIETAGGNRDRPTGRTLLITERILASLDRPATCASFCRFLRIDRNVVDPRYVFWYLQYLYSRGVMWNHQVQHTGVARFQYTKFAETTEIPLPARRKQESIADILCTMDDKIELNRRMNNTLETMARRLFKSWFVDFDPVHAKAALRREHPELSNAELSRRALPNIALEIAELFPDAFEDSTLGPIPKGWTATAWGEIATLEYGRSLSNYKGGDGKYRVFGTNGPIGWHSEPLWNGEGIIIGRKGAYRGVHFSPFPFFAIDTAFYLKPKTEIDFRWAYLELLAADINSMDSGSAIPSTSREDMYSIPVRFPTPPILRAFGEKIRSIDAAKISYHEESEHLADVRDKLLPKLLSGELAV